jgi:hypothetical protein
VDALEDRVAFLEERRRDIDEKARETANMIEQGLDGEEKPDWWESLFESRDNNPPVVDQKSLEQRNENITLVINKKNFEQLMKLGLLWYMAG